MSRYHPGWDLTKLLDAAEHVKHHCFVEDGSVFGEERLWYAGLVTEAKAKFLTDINEDITGYLPRLEQQMTGAQPEVLPPCCRTELVTAFVCHQLKAEDQTGAGAEGLVMVR